jgi:hypothetical protein
MMSIAFHYPLDIVRKGNVHLDITAEARPIFNDNTGCPDVADDCGGARYRNSIIGIDVAAHLAVDRELTCLHIGDYRTNLLDGDVILQGNVSFHSPLDDKITGPGQISPNLNAFSNDARAVSHVNGPPEDSQVAQKLTGIGFSVNAGSCRNGALASTGEEAA